MKFLEENNTGEALLDIGVGTTFWTRPPKHRQQKPNQTETLCETQKLLYMKENLE